jgi:hypothetical protein
MTDTSLRPGWQAHRLPNGRTVFLAALVRGDGSLHRFVEDGPPFANKREALGLARRVLERRASSGFLRRMGIA